MYITQCESVNLTSKAWISNLNKKSFDIGINWNIHLEGYQPSHHTYRGVFIFDNIGDDMDTRNPVDDVELFRLKKNHHAGYCFPQTVAFRLVECCYSLVKCLWVDKILMFEPEMKELISKHAFKVISTMVFIWSSYNLSTKRRLRDLFLFEWIPVHTVEQSWNLLLWVVRKPVKNPVWENIWYKQPCGGRERAHIDLSAGLSGPLKVLAC